MAAVEPPSRASPAPSANGTPTRPAPGAVGRRVRRFAHAVPTVLTFALLAGVGYWGHSTGWAMPKLAALTGAAPEPADDWCDAHNVPESVCVECHESLMPRAKAFGWCPVHGVGECPTCHPEVAQVTGKPEAFPYDPTGPLALLPRPENNGKCPLPARRLQFASAAAADKAGIDIDVVGTRPMAEAVTGHGAIGYDPTSVVRLSARAAGTVWRVFKVVGDPVYVGEVVALVDAADVGKAKTEYANAVVQTRLRSETVDRYRKVGGSMSTLEMQAAEAAAEEARLRLVTAEQALANLGLPVAAAADADAKEIVGRLRFLGLPPELAGRLAAEAVTANTLLPVKATQPGLVVAGGVVAGEAADPSKMLLTTADTRRLWLTLHVQQEQVKHLAAGLPVRFLADAGGAELRGTVAWVSTAVDDKTRTVPVRVDVPNPDGKLKANTFGTGRVILREEARAVSVPKAAVQWEGCCHVVFVRDKDYLAPDAPKVFHVRQVRPGAADETHVELLAGVLLGEVIVTKGSAMLRGELLRSALGEGEGGGSPKK